MRWRGEITEKSSLPNSVYSWLGPKSRGFLVVQNYSFTGNLLKWKFQINMETVAICESFNVKIKKNIRLD